MSTEVNFDLALPEERDPVTTGPETPSRQERLPGLLRILGAGILVVTMYSFLVDGWRHGNDSLRYLMMLGHTGALAAIGLASLRWLNEAKGARLLLSLALVAVPANFAILGALVLSAAAGVDPSAYPHYVAWQASSAVSVGLITLGAAAVLIPLTLFGFRILARAVWARIAGVFLFNNALLLMPIREGDILAGVVAAALVLTLWTNHIVTRGRSVTGTREGMLALLLPFLPLGVMMGRSLWLYSTDHFLLASTCLGTWFFLRQISAWLERDSRSRWTLELLSAVPALAITVPLAGIVVSWDIQELIMPLAGLGSAALFYDLSRRATAAPLYRWFAGFLLLASQGINLVMFGTLPAAVVALASGLALVAAGFRQRQRSLLFSGALLVAGAILHQLWSLIVQFELGSWLGLGALGILAIVLASVLESSGGRLAALVKYRWRELDSWQS